MPSFTSRPAEWLRSSGETTATRRVSRLPADWHKLPEALQLVLAQEWMLCSAAILAEQAELLALEMYARTLVDHGGPDALPLFAAIVRSINANTLGPVGHA